MFLLIISTLLLASAFSMPTNQEAGETLGRPLDEDDFARAKELDEKYLARPIDMPGPILIGDSIFIDETNAIKDARKLWPGARVPYTIDGKFNNNDRAVIARAIQRYRETSCLRFEPKQARDGDHIHIQPSCDGCCNSLVGKHGGRQVVNLGKGCVHVNLVEHELMHAIGFEHEHQRPDRDTFIRIKWENIDERMKFAFNKLNWNQVQSLGEPYDYGSVMHYWPTGFSKNGKPTMEKLKAGPALGSAKDFSGIDIKKIRKLYKCK